MASKIIILTVSSADSGINWSVKLSSSPFNSDSGYEADSAIINQVDGYVYPIVPTAAQLGLTGVTTYMYRISPFSGDDPIRTYSDDDKYATFRDGGNPQFLTSGFSMDIFSTLFVDNLNNNMTWNDMTVAGIGSGNTYSLNANKHSLVYYYSSRWAPCWSKGGTLTVTAV